MTDLLEKDQHTLRHGLRIRIIFGETEMIGPGRAELMERIDSTRSLAAAGREMDMSYKRANELIGTLNTMFHAAVVASTPGGAGGGGAVLTEMRREVLRLYRGLEPGSARARAPQLDALCELFKDITVGK